MNVTNASRVSTPSETQSVSSSPAAADLRPSSRPYETLKRYALATLVVVASLLIRRLLDPLLGPQAPYLTVWAAVVFASWHCGLGPAIFSVVVAGAGSLYLFMPHVRDIGIRREDMWGLLGFLFFSSLIVMMGELNRRSQARRDTAEKEAEEIRNLLEERIRLRTQEIERKTEEIARQAQLLDSANDAIFVRSKDNTITYWNKGAARLYGWQEHEVLGRSTSEILETEFPVSEAEVLQSGKDYWEGELRHRKRDRSVVTVASRWTTLRDAKGEISGWLEINTDITWRKQAEEGVRKLGGRMLQLQDQERRKFARELHDGIGQYLASIKMILDTALRPETPPEQLREHLEQSIAILDTCLTETRTVSHLLHPPLLDEAGLTSAIQWYAQGFSQRSGIQVDLHLQPDIGRLPNEIEITLFRILQESLTNIHRHAEATHARVIVGLKDRQIRMQVSDTGRGIPEEQLRQWREIRAPLGVGMAGMVERTREMGGTFDVQSNGSGTTVTVVIPISGKLSAVAAIHPTHDVIAS